MSNTIARKKHTLRLVLLLVSICAIAHLLSLSLTTVDGHDADVHLLWLQDIAMSFGRLNWYPRWSSLSLHGFGAPIFYLYPPLTFWIGAILSWCVRTNDPEILFKIVSGIAYVGSLATCYLFVRSQGWARPTAAFASLFYSFSAYRFHTLYTRSALPEDVAYVLIPIVFWGVITLVRDRTHALAFFLTGISITALLLTNIPISCSMFVLLTIYLIRVGLVEWKSAATIALSLLLGVISASVLLLPAYDAQSMLSISDLFHPGEHSPLSEMWNSGYLVNRTLLPAIFIACVLGYAGYSKQREGDEEASDVSREGLRWLWLVALAFQVPFVFFILARFLLPLRLIQFPWRFDVVLTLLLSLGVLTKVSNGRSNRFTQFSLYTLLLSAVLTLLLTLSVIFHFRAGVHPVDTSGLRPEYRATFMRADRTSATDSLLGFTDKIRIRSMSGEGRLAQLRMGNAFDQWFSIDLPQADTLVINQYYWPTWRASVGEQALTTWPDSCGRTLVTAPAGNWRLRLRLTKSKIEKYGEALTWVGLSMLILISVALYAVRRRMLPPSGSIA